MTQISRSAFYSFVLTSVLCGAVAMPALAQGGAVPPPPPMMIDDILDEGKVDLTPNAARVMAPAPELPGVFIADEPAPAPVIKKKAPTKKKAQNAPSSSSMSRTENVIESLIKQKGDAGPRLLLQDALRQVYLENPTLNAARVAVRAIAENKAQAGSYWKPQVSASADVTYGRRDVNPGDVSSGTEKSVGITVAQPLYRGGRTMAGERAADAEVDAYLAMLATTERAIFFQTAQAYMDVLQAQATVAVNEKNSDAITRQLRATRDRFDAGDLTRTDVAQAEFRLARAQADVTTSIGTLHTARAVFEQLTGMMPERLALPGPSFTFPGQQEDAVMMAETYNPDVIMAQAVHAAAVQNIDVQFGALLPEISLSAGASMTRDPSGGTYDDVNASQAGLSLTVPLYEGGAVRSRVRQARHTANQKYIGILEARRSAREEAVRAWETLNAARAELKSRESQVRAAEIARDGVRQEAEVGSRTVLDSLDADQEVRDAQISLIGAKRNEVVAEYALASAIGLLLPGNVGIKEQIFDPADLGN